ncbi:MAG TPA: phosphatidylglycerophosphatase A [Alphaproteobacteria bacterium]|nr:phosphatidylglycerophosphatase A [Alphaproteobacteria bacterium]
MTPDPTPPRGAALIATLAGLGRVGPGPGTLGSLATLPFAWLASRGGVAAVLALALAAFAIGWWASEQYVRGRRTQDPGEVIIDEVAGQALTLAFAPQPLGLLWLIAGFALFRLFDIWKPWPVSLAERRFKAGLGIMADDIVAALYGGLVLIAARLILGT